MPLAAPADRAALDEAERALGLPLPGELRALLAQCNGVTDRFGTEVIWPVEALAPRNEEFRTAPAFRELYMPFDALLFFGGAGNGDQFFYPILTGQVRNADVFLWDHETDSRRWLAPRLDAFLETVLRSG